MTIWTVLAINKLILKCVLFWIICRPIPAAVWSSMSTWKPIAPVSLFMYMTTPKRKPHKQIYPYAGEQKYQNDSQTAQCLVLLRCCRPTRRMTPTTTTTTTGCQEFEHRDLFFRSTIYFADSARLHKSQCAMLFSSSPIDSFAFSHPFLICWADI